ncbi:MAG: type II secretion system protein GspC [Thiogranum sp.]|nr:type II secretion system protein GspC [Thiogranum sp.]
MVSLALPHTTLQHWLHAGRIRQLPTMINVLLIVWLAWLIAGLSWMIIPAPDEASQAVATQSAAVQRRQPLFDERQIAGWHLFGIAGKEQPVKTTPVNAPETRLKLTLHGVFSSENVAQARAIVGDPRGKEQGYSVGDPLPGGARLAEIYPDRIILERSGRFETLRLPRELVESGSGAANSAVSPKPSGSVDRAVAFNRYRTEVKNNPAAILNYLRATPAREGGEFIGFNIQPGPQPGALEELGLQPGDVVTAINGVAIDSPATGMQAMQSLGEGDTASVTLLRGGQEMSLSLVLPTTEQ